MSMTSFSAVSSSIRLAVLDDHPLYREGVVVSLARYADFEVIAQGASCDDAISIVRNGNVDLVLLDLNMPGGGISAAAKISKLAPNVRIVFLTFVEDEIQVQSALDSGAHGYILKGVEERELVSALRSIVKGEEYVTPQLAVKLLYASRCIDALSSDQLCATKCLSARDRELLGLIATGMTNSEIAREMALSESTVKRNISMLLRKAGLRNRVDAALRGPSLISRAQKLN